MQIVSYNVNGIRSAMGKGLLNWMESRKADVYCFQETKASPEQVDLTPFEFFGYKSYWVSAEKKGYSGVAIFTKHEIKNLQQGFGNALYDSEGRWISADIGDTTIASVYIPSGSSGDDRQAFKMRFLDFFYEFIADLRKEKKNLISCGDYNICHKPIDIHDPIGNKNSSGYLPEEREWMTKFIESGYIDSFRHIQGDVLHQYSWWTFRAGARARNKGWRIDYCMCSENFNNQIIDAGILQDVIHSDHCPVWVKI
jgi:exodeoxyribonuclease III